MASTTNHEATAVENEEGKQPLKGDRRRLHEVDDDATKMTTLSTPTVKASNVTIPSSSNENENSTAIESNPKNKKNKLQCLVLYQAESPSSPSDKERISTIIPQTLVQPFTEEDNPLLSFMNHSSVSNILVDQPLQSICCIEYDGQVWNDTNGPNAIVSCQVLLDLVQAMERHGKRLVTCCDLYVSKHTAGTLFFEEQEQLDHDDEDDGQVEMACIGFHGINKIRLIQLPSEETQVFTEQVIRQYWKFGLEKYDGYKKYGNVPEYKLNNDPWSPQQLDENSSNELYLESRRLVCGLLQFMYNHGWTKVKAVDCTISNPTSSTEPLACLCLEKTHKLRLLGDNIDGETYQTLAKVIGEYWKLGIKESRVFDADTNSSKSTSYQIKLNGDPWYHITTKESILAASLLCIVIEALQQQGWYWYCSIDITRDLWDKSNFFFHRRRYNDPRDDPASSTMIGCIQPKGRSKINLVRFPQTYLITLIQQLQQTCDKDNINEINTRLSSWPTESIKNITIHDYGDDDGNQNDPQLQQPHGSATIEFNYKIHDFKDSLDAARNSKLYLTLLTQILHGYPRSELLGCGDIWTCQLEMELRERDTDVFFLSFPVTSSHLTSNTDSHSNVESFRPIV